MFCHAAAAVFSTAQALFEVVAPFLPLVVWILEIPIWKCWKLGVEEGYCLLDVGFGETRGSSSSSGDCGGGGGISSLHLRRQFQLLFSTD